MVQGFLHYSRTYKDLGQLLFIIETEVNLLNDTTITPSEDSASNAPNDSAVPMIESTSQDNVHQVNDSFDQSIVTGAKLLLHLRNAHVHNTEVFLRGSNYKKAQNLSVDDVQKVNIMDNGADTSVIGKGGL